MKKRVLSATVPPWLFDWLGKPRCGEVRIVTSRGIYLMLDEQTLLLCSRKWGLTPIGMALPEEAEPEIRNIQPGQRVLWQEETLQFPEVQLPLKLERRSLMPVLANPNPERVDAGEKMLSGIGTGKGLAAVYGAWMLGREQKSTTLLCRTALLRLRALTEGLQTGDDAAAADAVCALLGLGNGLTPSADDVLCGMLYVLLRSAASREERVQSLARVVCREAPMRTNAVSAACLTAIATGAEYERMHDVLRWLSGQGENCVYRLLEVGSSSGSDMLMGMLAACRLLEWE